MWINYSEVCLVPQYFLANTRLPTVFSVEMVAKSVEVTGHVVLTHGSVTNLPVTDANKTTVPITIRFPSDVLPGQAPEKRDNRYMAITPASIAALQVKEGAPVALEGRQSRIQAEQAPSLAGVDSLIDGVTSHIRNRLGRMKLRSAMRSPGKHPYAFFSCRVNATQVINGFV